jgi:hypothetical protein
VYNRYLYPDCSQHDCICRLLTSGLCLTYEKKVCICEKLIKTDWNHSLPSSPPMLSSPSNFNCVSSSKTIPTTVPKTYATVVSTLVNEQVEKLKKYIMRKWQT